MKILAVYLAQEDVDNDIFLNLIPVADDSYETILAEISSRYNVEEETFVYYPVDEQWENVSGQFVADSPVDSSACAWEYAVREV